MTSTREEAMTETTGPVDESHDEQVKAAIAAHPGARMVSLMGLCLIHGSDVKRIRALDHTLQRLRRRGEIEFSVKAGWRVTE